MVHYLSINHTRLLQFCSYIQIIPFISLTETDRNVQQDIIYKLHLSLRDPSQIEELRNLVKKIFDHQIYVDETQQPVVNPIYGLKWPQISTLYMLDWKGLVLGFGLSKNLVKPWASQKNRKYFYAVASLDLGYESE